MQGMRVILVVGAIGVSASAAQAQQDPYQPDWYVDVDAAPGGNGLEWSTAFKTLDEALGETAEVPGVIWVAEGTYVPTVRTDSGDPRSVTFNIPAQTIILGGFDGTETNATQRDIAVNPTILSGLVIPTSGAPYRAYHVVSAISSAQNRRIDGFIIENGLADGSATADKHGGGIYIASSGATVVANCTFRLNHAEEGGGGLWGLNSALTTVTVFNCIFRENHAHTGGGMQLEVNTTTVENPLRCVNNDFWRNTASGKGGGLFIDNSDDLAGSENVVLNCTFAENEAGEEGAAIAAEDEESSYTVRNSIVWDNSVDEVIDLDTQFHPDGITISYSCVVGVDVAVECGPSFSGFGGPQGMTPEDAVVALGFQSVESFNEWAQAADSGEVYAYADLIYEILSE